MVRRESAVRSWRSGMRWRGAGGRWLIWAARTIAWVALIVVGYRGVLAIIEGWPGQAPAAASSAASSAAPAARFPAALAEAYAAQFGDVYLTFSPATAAQRGRELARFLPSGADPQLGWNGAGTQQVLAEQVAGISVTSPHTAVVTLLALLSGNQTLELGVPVYAAGDGMTVSGEPALLPGPAHISVPSAQPSGDQATEAVLRHQLPAFFQAYASGDSTTLARFAAPGARIAGLGGSVQFAGIDSVYAPVGGKHRQASVTVTWDLRPAQRSPAGVASAPAALPMTYRLALVRQGASWDVLSVSASAERLGSP